MKRTLAIVTLMTLLNVPLLAGTAAAYPAETCTSRTTDPVTIGVAGQPVHVPSVYVKACLVWSADHSDIPAFPPQVENDPSLCGDPTRPCITVTENLDNLARPNGVAVEYSLDGGSVTSKDAVLPPIPGTGPTCFFSTGYPVAPRHDCLVYIDQGA